MNEAQPSQEEEESKVDPEEYTLLPSIHRRAMPPPPSDNSPSAAKVATPEPTESEPTESEPKEAAGPRKLNTNLPISSGLDIAPMDAIVEMVNGNLKNCAHHKDTPLVLGLHCRIGFASNWRLSCKMCDKDSVSVKNSIDYLKRTLDSCDDRVEFRAVK